MCSFCRWINWNEKVILSFYFYSITSNPRILKHPLVCYLIFTSVNLVRKWDVDILTRIDITWYIIILIVNLIQSKYVAFAQLLVHRRGGLLWIWEAGAGGTGGSAERQRYYDNTNMPVWCFFYRLNSLVLFLIIISFIPMYLSILW